MAALRLLVRGVAQQVLGRRFGSSRTAARNSLPTRSNR